MTSDLHLSRRCLDVPYLHVKSSSPKTPMSCFVRKRFRRGVLCRPRVKSLADLQTDLATSYCVCYILCCVWVAMIPEALDVWNEVQDGVQAGVCSHIPGQSIAECSHGSVSWGSSQHTLQAHMG